MFYFGQVIKLSKNAWYAYHWEWWEQLSIADAQVIFLLLSHPFVAYLNAICSTFYQLTQTIEIVQYQFIFGGVIIAHWLAYRSAGASPFVSLSGHFTLSSELTSTLLMASTIFLNVFSRNISIRSVFGQSKLVGCVKTFVDFFFIRSITRRTPPSTTRSTLASERA